MLQCALDVIGLDTGTKYKLITPLKHFCAHSGQIHRYVANFICQFTSFCIIIII